MGHAYEAIIADSLARYHRAFGRNVFFMTGTDEHGQKIANAAEALGVTVRYPWPVFASCLLLLQLVRAGQFWCAYSLAITFCFQSYCAIV